MSCPEKFVLKSKHDKSSKPDRKLLLVKDGDFPHYYFNVIICHWVVR